MKKKIVFVSSRVHFVQSVGRGGGLLRRSGAHIGPYICRHRRSVLIYFPPAVTEHPRSPPADRAHSVSARRPLTIAIHQERFFLFSTLPGGPYNTAAQWISPVFQRCNRSTEYPLSTLRKSSTGYVDIEIRPDGRGNDHYDTLVHCT